MTEHTDSPVAATTDTNTKTRVGWARFAWGSALILGAASGMGPALFPNFFSELLSVADGWDRWGHEAPVVVATTVGASSATPEPATPAPETQAATAPRPMRLLGTLTDPDDTRAAVAVGDVLWVATGGGLLRVDPEDADGDRWWTSADGLPDHRLTAIARYGDGLAVGTEGGLVVTLGLPGLDQAVDGAASDLDSTPLLDVRTVDKVADARISDLLGEDELLWVATWGEGAFSGVPGAPKGFAELGPSRGLRARQLTGIARLDGELVAGTAGAGLWVRDDAGRSQLFVSKGGLISDFVLDVERVGDRVLVAGPGGMSRYRGGVIQTFAGGDRVPAGVVRAIGDGARPALAVAGGRLGRWGTADTEPLPGSPDGLGPWHGVAAPEVRWVRTVGNHQVAGTARGVLLRRTDAPEALAWRTHGGPGNNDLTSVDADGDVLLVGSFDGGAWRRVDGRWTALSAPTGEINDVALDVGVAWLATSRGLARVDPAGRLRTWGRNQGLASEHVSALTATEDGLLVGTTAGVARFDGVGFAPLGAGLASGPRNVYSVAARDGEVWVGTLEGAWRFADGAPGFDSVGSTTRVRYETGELPDSWVNAVTIAPDGRLWVGTYDHGLATVGVDGRWSSLTEGDDLPCGWVNPDALVALDDGTALVGTLGGGLLRVDPTGAIDRWTAADGLAGDDVTGLAVDGQDVWVATRSGLSRLELGPRPPAARPPLSPPNPESDSEEVRRVADRS
mgnify:CR=1 FL=1